MTSVEKSATIDRMAEKLTAPIRRARGVSTSNSLPPAPDVNDSKYDKELARLAAKMLYRSGHDASGNPLLILSAAAFPDAREVDYLELLPYVLALLPGEDEMQILDKHVEAGRAGYSVIFFAGGGKGDKDSKSRPSWSWTVQAYHLLGRAVRKRIKKLWVVHEKAWVRVMLEMLSGVVSNKFRKKIIHVDNLTELANMLDITRLNIQPAVYLYDKKSSDSIILPAFPPRPQFNYVPFPTPDAPLPQVLVDTSRYIRTNCLDTEGLFRIPPSSQLLEVAREAYDRKQFMLLSDYGPHIAAGLTKLYYRTLPEPVVPRAHYDKFHEFGNLSDDNERIESARNLLDNVLSKDSKRLLLQHLIPLLALVASHAENNKMPVSNLAICFAPSFVRSEEVMEDAQVARTGVTKFLEVLVDNIDSFTTRMPDRVAKTDDAKSPPAIKRSAALKSKKSQQYMPRVDVSDNTPEYTIRMVEASPIEISRPAIKSRKSSTQIKPTTQNTNANGMPSPPPSPSSEIPDLPFEPLQPTRQFSFNPISQSPPKASSSPPPKPSTSPKLASSSPKRSSSPTDSTEINTSGTMSPPRVTPQIRSLMRVQTTPALSANSPASVVTLRQTSTTRSTSPSPAPTPSNRNLLRHVSDSSALPKIGRVKPSGRAVDELRALYEERAKGAEILVRVGSQRASSNKWK